MSETNVTDKKMDTVVNFCDDKPMPEPPPVVQEAPKTLTWQMKYFPTFCRLFGIK